ncbi:MAG: metal ABC transporter ATP-binding protein [Fibrobacter sp.]|jgi:zinc transport system ATP-binding protein|nr:metal ABC transporter ATP-binding protein [Fibrobacter sp.]
MNAIEIRNMNFSYGNTPALENVSFSVSEGDFLGIIGPNGGGKTTLLKLMLGLLKPDTGEVKIFSEKPLSNKNRVGYVPQNTHQNVSFPITAAECVATGLVGMKKNSKKVLETLELVNMENGAGKRLSSFSGGERQRILIARALVSDPQILFLDEASSNIDFLGQDEFYRLLEKLNSRMTIVVVSHDMAALSKRIKSIVCVNRTVHFHPNSKITSKILEEVYGCEIDLIGHGIPHRILGSHDHTHGGCCS